jgi:hypothetical protein
MSDATYQPKVYRDMGGDRQVIAGGGILRMEPGSMIQYANPTGAADYYVDLNVSATGDGSIDSPFSTVAEAIAASNTSIGLTANRWWARRNRIFVMGDGITESLTVLPEKCDIIGIGSDLHPFPRITGAHTIAVAKVGCRFINMGFTATGTGDLFVIPAGCHGLEFHGCFFQAAAAGNTKCLEITNSAIVKVCDCRIVQNPAAYATGIFGIGISIEGTTANHQTLISGNWINATVGIKVATSAPCYDSVICNNFIHSVSYWVDDDSAICHVIDNRGITDIDTGTSTAGYDFTLALAAGNIQTGSGGETDSVPYMLIAEA